MIDQDARAVFEMVRDPHMRNVALFECVLDGAPTVAIVSVLERGELFDIRPLYVAVTPRMLDTLTDCEGHSAVNGEGKVNGRSSLSGLLRTWKK